MLRKGWELCEKIEEDILEREHLERKHPQTFKVIRYEDLATNPLETATEIFEFLDSPLPQSVREWLVSSTSDTKARETPLSTSRRNSTSTAYHWMSDPTVPRDELAKKCQFVLQKFDYDP